ncbi:hypothetical protein CKM354_000081500 [Cercospora kikuchii]|uniref:Uncharacterized protein n=1 Tax=Cercospora kikuchii TaxID=84275 RepID=A0A9P3FCA3_9PEZI|nr:uncharacterized protein CKM354_000081500 [Cercospora kikuchii]GIZ37365.1 hypothetical protein CKM354_000081500 [Cercospora kikuchii]
MELSYRRKQALEEIVQKRAELAAQNEELDAQAAAVNAESIAMMEKFDRMKDNMGVIELDMWREMYSEMDIKRDEIMASVKHHKIEMNRLLAQCNDYLEEWKKQDEDSVAAPGDSAEDEE